MHDRIVITGARMHNLKNVSLTIPKYKLVAFTGVSGSGKSTLALDTLHREGQRQYIESLGLATDAVSNSQVERIEGLSPTISVDQHLTNHSPRSTVGTATDVYTYLRILFARVGHRPCPRCMGDVPPPYQGEGELGASGGRWWADETPGSVGSAGEGNEEESTYPCPHCGAPITEIGMAHFSFNKPEGACPTCTGLGVVQKANLHRLVDLERSVRDGGVLTWNRPYIEYSSTILQAAGKHYGFTFDLDIPIGKLGPAQRDLLLCGVGSQEFRRHFPDKEPPAAVGKGRFEGLIPGLMRRYTEHAHDSGYRERMGEFLASDTCPECQGTRLRLESRLVTIAGQTIVDVCRLPFTELARWLEGLPSRVSPDELAITEAIMSDLRERLRRLLDVGVGYLTNERSTPTLSEGEAQRLRLAALLGSELTGVLYVLDEPTIGLHPRDTDRLMKVLTQLRDLGNTVLVIEHDLDVLRAADYIVDFGPGGGRNGGQVVAAGTPDAVGADPQSLTGDYLSGRLSAYAPDERRQGSGRHLTIRGARAHNLKNVSVSIPLGVFVAVTGPSGSGKSSLMLDVFDRAARRHFYGAADEPGEHDGIEGLEYLDRVITIDQKAIGRMARSNAATYTDAFTPIRETFAATPAARERGLTAGHFSFNIPGGRCDRCEGAGLLSVEMHFLTDVYVRCPACRGRRYKREVLEVQFGGYDISAVLEMTIEEALSLFRDVLAVATRLSLMADVGLGYLQMGQPASTFSGGEAQRIKLAKELARKSGGHSLYLLDEPTTGLHPADTARLMALLQRLVAAGNTVVVIEHNLDVIRAADWIIDLGPEGGDAGGQVMATGTPESVAQAEGSHTATYLRQLLR